MSGRKPKRHRSEDQHAACDRSRSEVLDLRECVRSISEFVSAEKDRDGPHVKRLRADLVRARTCLDDAVKDLKRHVNAVAQIEQSIPSRTVGLKHTTCNLERRAIKEMRHEMRSYGWSSDPKRTKTLYAVCGVPAHEWTEQKPPGNSYEVQTHELFGLVNPFVKVDGTKTIPGREVLSSRVMGLLVFLATYGEGLFDVKWSDLVENATSEYKSDKITHRIPVPLTYDCHTVLAYQPEPLGHVVVLDSWPSCFDEEKHAEHNAIMYSSFATRIQTMFDVVGYKTPQWRHAGRRIKSSYNDDDDLLEIEERQCGPVRYICPQLQHERANSCTMYAIAWMIAIWKNGPQAVHDIAHRRYQLNESLMRQHTWEIIRSGRASEYPTT